MLLENFFLNWTMNLIDVSIFSLSHIKAASDGGAGHEEVDDIDHYQASCNSGTESRKIVPKVGN